MGFLADILDKTKVDGKSPFARIEDEIWSKVPFYISTGSDLLDWAIKAYQVGETGGIPHTRLVEIFGPESSGKSSLFDSIAVSLQRSLGGFVLLADAEHAHDKERMIQQGIDPELISMIENEPNKKGIREDISLEEFFLYSKEAVKAIRCEDPSTPILVGLDSLAMINTNIQRDKINKGEDLSMKDDLDKSRVMSQRLGNWTSFMVAHGVTPIIINQLRDKPGVIFGDTTYTPGGNTLRFLASLRINLGKGSVIRGKEDVIERDPDDPVGLRIPFEIKKNKIAPPFSKGSFSLMFDERGIWNQKDLFDYYFNKNYHQKENAKFNKSGAWYNYGDERMGQGSVNALTFLMENPDVMADMIEEIKGENINENNS